MIAHRLAILDTMPYRLSSLVRGWYLCMRCVRSTTKLAEKVCLQCYESLCISMYYVSLCG